MLNKLLNKEEYIDMRVDRFLKKYTNYTNSEIFSIIKQGKIKINSKKTKENYRIKKEDEITLSDKVILKKLKDYNIKDFDYGKMIYEDDNIFIIYKNKSIPMHKGTNNKYGVSEYFKKKYNSQDVSFISRLDKKTSGLVIGSKNLITTRELSKLMKEKKIEKEYIAKVRTNNIILSKLKGFNDFKKVVIVEDGKELISYFKIINKEENSKGIELTFRIKLETGKKHQIRKQMKSLGLEIIGDDKYGSYNKKDELELECTMIKFTYKGKIIHKELNE